MDADGIDRASDLAGLAELAYAYAETADWQPLLNRLCSLSGAAAFLVAPCPWSRSHTRTGCSCARPDLAGVPDIRRGAAEGRRVNDRGAARIDCHSGFGSSRERLHVMVGAIEVAPEITCKIQLIRSCGSGPFEDGHFALLHALMPHVRRAYRLHARQAESNVIRTVLDRQPAGIVLISTAGEVGFVNRAARSILASADGLSLVNGRLWVSRRDESAELFRLIEQTGALPTDGSSPGCAISISRPSMLRPYSVLVTPVPGSPPVAAPAHAALYISDPEQRAAPVCRWIARFYGLTPSEARVAARIAAGESVMSAGESLGISYETARTHTKRIMQKTGARRQGDLVRILMRSPQLEWASVTQLGDDTGGGLHLD